MILVKRFINWLFCILALAIEGDDVHQELDYAELLEPKLRKIFYETYKEVAEQYSKIYNVLKYGF